MGWTVESESAGELDFVPVPEFGNKHVRTHIKIDYNNGQIKLERPDWPASALPEPWV